MAYQRRSQQQLQCAQRTTKDPVLLGQMRWRQKITTISAGTNEIISINL